ncbi:YcgN family cysteine cluster protein [Ferrovibrio sp.]|uniref:YcgN family cysteine cluster protein n=1 Tax=Ferrovibrio sp. TaxID=1917215 RepID=UPI003D0A12E0
MPAEKPFWRRKTLKQLTTAEWESLCDGCGKCCLYRLEDEDEGTLEATNVACRLLDCKSGACSNYAKRKEIVPDCIKLTPAVVAKMDWLPATCGYRRVHLGKDLPWWHYLKSGDRDLVHKLGVSVRGKAISELKSGPLEHHIVDWVDHPGPPKPKKQAKKSAKPR